MLYWIALLLAAQPPALSPGQVIANVPCIGDPSRSYALYLPSVYTADRAWPVILAFDPRARGHVPVEIYREAAEAYGFVIAGSNDSRNGSSEIARAVAAMSNDVASRITLDPKRIYTAGMSGGARVALGVALSAARPSKGIAGVVASSAGYPDSEPRRSLPFPVFLTAGTEDFNHLEMRLLDRALKTPHFLAVFEGGHTWPSSELAVEAVEWLEIQAMRSGSKAKDEAEIASIFAKRTSRIDLAATDATTFLALQAIVADFEGLSDVTRYAARASVLRRDETVKDAIRKAHDEDDRERRLLVEIKTREAQLAMADQRALALADLRRTWKELRDQADRPDDSAQRRLARRVLAAVAAGTAATDPDYLMLIGPYRSRRR